MPWLLLLALACASVARCGSGTMQATRGTCSWEGPSLWSLRPGRRRIWRVQLPLVSASPWPACCLLRMHSAGQGLHPHRVRAPTLHCPRPSPSPPSACRKGHDCNCAGSRMRTDREMCTAGPRQSEVGSSPSQVPTTSLSYAAKKQVAGPQTPEEAPIRAGAPHCPAGHPHCTPPPPSPEPKKGTYPAGKTPPSRCHVHTTVVHPYLHLAWLPSLRITNPPPTKPQSQAGGPLTCRTRRSWPRACAQGEGPS